jgi:hypothetical protein
VDALLVRIPRHRGRTLDEHDGLPYALKAVADEVTKRLWPRDGKGKLVGTPDDSAPWLRWLYAQRPHRKARKRPRPGDPRPDPPNKGTELCEIVIASRHRCPYCEDVPHLVRAWREL